MEFGFLILAALVEDRGMLVCKSVVHHEVQPGCAMPTETGSGSRHVGDSVSGCRWAGNGHAVGVVSERHEGRHRQERWNVEERRAYLMDMMGSQAKVYVVCLW